MDSNVLTIILGLMTNGLSSLIAQLGHKSGKLLIGKEFLDKWELEKTALQPILQKAISEVEESIQWTGPSKEEIVCLFLLSPEIEEIVRQIYSTKLLRKKENGSLKLIRRVFLSSFYLFLSSYPSNIKLNEEMLADPANLLFDTLISGCELALDNAIDKGILAAHEAKSAFRHQILLDEIAALQKKLDFLTAQQKPNILAIHIFERKYCQQVSSRHKYIIPPYLDTAKKLPLSKIYVLPRFKTNPKKNEEAEVLNMVDFLSSIYRVVILGNPGGGKSTFALKLCYELATHRNQPLFSGRKQVTPILVILREYGAEKKVRNCSILQFIEAKSNANYQIQPPPNAFEYLLLNGRAVVIFDGLDELLDTSYRQEITSDVESFCNLYPSVPVLVTFREVGYEHAPLDDKKFPIFRLALFNNDQVEEYVKKWFGAVYKDLPLEQREQQGKTFLKESKIVPDLCSNPLMLALMCNIYRGENYIPRNRPDVYEKCANMLFERWDKSRGIHVTLPFDWHIRPMMEYLAYWIYMDEKLRGGVTEEALTTKATEYLSEWLFDDYNKAERAAQEFVNFCTGRAWVFSDAGTKKEGEKLYQFAHTTFLEYFTASHLVRMYRTPEALIDLLQPRIAKQEWDVMAQLAFQLQNKKIAGAGDELLTALIDRAHVTKIGEAWNILSFAARCLEFIIPRPKVTREIINACFDRFLSDGVHWLKKGETISRITKNPLSQRSRDAFGGMWNALPENTTIINDHLGKRIVDVIANSSETEGILALEVGLFAYPRVEDLIFNTCTNRLEILYPKYFWLCYEAVDERKLPISDLIKWYGMAGLFCAQRSIYMNRICLAQLMARRILDSPHDPSFSDWIIDHMGALIEIGPIMLSHPTPWFIESSPKSDVFSTFWFGVNHSPATKQVQALKLNSDSLFSAFALFAVLLEAQELITDGDRGTGVKEIASIIKYSKCLFFDFIRWALCARYMSVSETKVQEELDRGGFTNEQKNFVWLWIKQEVELIKLIPSKDPKGEKAS